MRRLLKLGSLCMFCCLMIQTSVGADTLEIRYFQPQNIYRFADRLYSEGDYLRAAGEFQRYLFSFESLPLNADSIFYRIGLCYRHHGDYARAADYFQKIIADYALSKLLFQSYHQTALCYTLMRRYENSTALLSSNLPTANHGDVRSRMLQLMAVNHLQQREWTEAIDLLNVSNDTEPITIKLASFATSGQQLPRKNKILAGFFSTVIPGAGKFYCNRPFDGVQSLATTGILGWQTYDGFHKDGIHSVKGWIFGVIGGIFYLGNIYGSVVAADIHNVEQEKRLFTEIQVFVNVSLD